MNGICPIGGRVAVCLPGEMFEHHGRAGPVEQGIVYDASGEGFRGGKRNGLGRRVGGGVRCSRQITSCLLLFFYHAKACHYRESSIEKLEQYHLPLLSGLNEEYEHVLAKSSQFRS